MRRLSRQWLATTALILFGVPVLAQTPPTAPATPPAAPAVKSDAVAATVNGQPVPEVMVQRALERIMPTERAKARPELVTFLIDNVLIEQYLLQMKINVEKAEVDKRIEDMRRDAEKQGGKKLEDLLKELKLTMEEMRDLMTADIRWDKYATALATEKALRDTYDGSKETFDDSMVRAKHILKTFTAGDSKAEETAQQQLQGYKKQVLEEVAAGLAKLPATTDALAREKARASLTDQSFAALARAQSACPSKTQGGDVNWFKRTHAMVEPFAKAAFALKSYEMSEPVKTQFGYHLILVTERKPGRDVKFEDVRDEVKEYYCEKLRENLLAQVRAKAQIVITPAPKP